jgi:methylphosphotriester-DNA--protein-cysteine methyltransferase
MRLPLISYFRAKKVMAANALMRHGYKAKEAALTMGFEDYSTFYRSYKRLFGKPPSQNE